MQITLNSFNDIPPHEPPLHASSSSIPEIRKWPILGFQSGLYHVVVPLRFLRSISLAPLFSK